jgi:hypothetical protein
MSALELKNSILQLIKGAHLEFFIPVYTTGAGNGGRIVLGSGILGSKVQADSYTNHPSKGPDSVLESRSASSDTTVRKDQRPGKRQRETDEDVDVDVEVEGEESEVFSAKRSSSSVGQGLGDGDFIAMPEVEDGRCRGMRTSADCTVPRI